KDFYCWVLQQLSRVLTILIDNSDVVTFITDRDLALMSAISTIFSNSNYQLCTCLIYDDLSESQTEQEIEELWTQFPSAKKYMFDAWMPYRESWLALYTKGNINLDIKSTQCVECLHEKLKAIENHVTPID
ncbi:21530_t:CDS:2, partial [Dentiscutata erythropus]